jgi:ergothioneine biosynthesis protein EgtC
MCRLLGYLGPPTQLDHLLYKPEHSLIVQSYQPREMQTAILNADGFGIGWYHAQRQAAPFTYRNTLPIWNDLNLPQISRYVESGSVMAYVRSATPGQAIDISNCQPFSYEQLLFTHNGFIENFRQTLYRPLRDRLGDKAYQAIHGLTDSEHLFALMIDLLEAHPEWSLEQALCQTLTVVTELATTYQVRAAVNIAVSDGDRMVACRYDTQTTAPSLYWLRDDPLFPDAVLIASEPLFEADWTPCPESSMLSVGADLDVQFYDPFDFKP